MRPTLTGLMVATTAPLALSALAVFLPCWTICGRVSTEIRCLAALRTDDVAVVSAASVAETDSVIMSRDAGINSAMALPANTRRADM